MAKVSPFHSREIGAEVYHDNDQCPEGNAIAWQKRVMGTAGLRKCEHCQKLK